MYDRKQAKYGVIETKDCFSFWCSNGCEHMELDKSNPENMEEGLDKVNFTTKVID